MFDRQRDNVRAAIRSVGGSLVSASAQQDVFTCEEQDKGFFALRSSLGFETQPFGCCGIVVRYDKPKTSQEKSPENLSAA